MEEETSGTSKYIVGEIERFDEKNVMFKRPIWDENLMALVKNFTGVSGIGKGTKTGISGSFVKQDRA